MGDSKSEAVGWEDPRAGSKDAERDRDRVSDGAGRSGRMKAARSPLASATRRLVAF